MFVRWLASALAIVLIALGASCSQVFGLDSPVLGDAAPADGSFDAAVTADCVTLPFAEYDDDNDGVIDVQDNCIGVTGAQMDADGDGIGTACDERAAKDTRHCVWTFRSPRLGEDPDFWTQSWTVPTPWMIKDSALSSDPSQPGTAVAMPKAGPFTSTAGIAFDTTVTLKGYIAPMAFGGQLQIASATGDAVYRCQLRQDSASNGTLELVRDAVVVDSLLLGSVTPMTVAAYVRFSAIESPNGELTVRCTVRIATEIVVLQHVNAGQQISVRPGLFADHAAVSYDHVTLYKLGI